MSTMSEKDRQNQVDAASEAIHEAEQFEQYIRQQEKDALIEQFDIKNPDHFTFIAKEGTARFTVVKTREGVRQEFGFTFPYPSNPDTISDKKSTT